MRTTLIALVVLFIGLARCTPPTESTIQALISSPDIVIIGSGPSAGAAVYEITHAAGNSDTVLVLEGGKLDTSINVTWLVYNRIQLGQRSDLIGYVGTTRPTIGLAGRTFLWPQTAEAVGGSPNWYNGNEVIMSLGMQQMMYEVTGNQPHYAPARFSAKVKQYETFHPSFRPADPARGTNGPIDVTRVPINGPQPISSLFCNSVINATGVAEVYDHSLASHGCSRSWVLYARPDGRRAGQDAFFNPQTLNIDYVPPVMRGDRITLLSNAFAHKLLIDPAKNPTDKHKVTGVTFMLNGMPYIARAKKAYYDASGLLSPQLLHVSGIGPCDWLEAAGIECIADLPVGVELTNHLAVGFTFSDPNNFMATDPSNFNFTNTMGAFVPDPRYPNDGVRGFQLIFQDGLSGDSITPNPAIKALTVFMLRPKSNGIVKPRSGQHRDQPEVYYNYNDPATDDENAWVAFIQDKIVKIAAKLQADAGITLTTPALSVIQDTTQLRAFLRGATGLRQTHHARGPSKMATRANGGVVDPATGAVFGFSNLFSCNTATMPVLADGNMMINVAATCGLHAQKAISIDWKA